MKPTLWLAAAALLAIGPADAGRYRSGIGGAMFAAPQQNRPGDISEAHFLIDNRGERQAVPVRIHQPPEDHAVRAEVTAPVTLAPSTVVVARAARTPWEYRTMAIPPNSDPLPLLGPLGQDGWEVTGSELARPDGVVLILKRPRETTTAASASPAR